MTHQKPALIIGNGPSVNLLDPALLKSFVTFGSNHIYKIFPEWGLQTDNVVITDSHRINEIGNAYKDFRGSMYVGDERYAYPPVRRIRKILGRDFIPLRQLTKETIRNWRILDRVRWHRLLYSTVFSKMNFTFNYSVGINFGYSVVISAIQIAIIEGYRTILLTGVDSRYLARKDYFAGAESSVGFVNESFIANPRSFMEPVLVALQIAAESIDAQIIDCTPNGSLRFIKKGNVSAYLP